MPILTIPQSVQRHTCFETVYTDSRDLEHPVEISFETSEDSTPSCITITNYWYYFPASSPRDQDICKEVRELIRLQLDCVLVDFLIK